MDMFIHHEGRYMKYNPRKITAYCQTYDRNRKAYLLLLCAVETLTHMHAYQAHKLFSQCYIAAEND